MGELTAEGPRPSAPEPLADRHDLASFSCGNADLDAWLRERARSSEGSTARTYVVAIGDRIVGYYCLAAGSVVRRELPRRQRHNTPSHVPILLLGRLAVDVTYQAQGYGSGLLKDAMLRGLNASRSIGIKALLVHAIDDDAAGFYRKYGFMPSTLSDRVLFLPIETIVAAL